MMTNGSDRGLFEAEGVGLQVTCFTSLEPDYPDMGIDDLHVLQEGAVVHPVPVRDDEMRPRAAGDVTSIRRKEKTAKKKGRPDFFICALDFLFLYDIFYVEI